MESTCPSLCLCLEAHCCNFAAVSASRMLVMERYNLSSDPCDHVLIQVSNCLQCLACICNILAVIGIPFAKESACLVNIIADIVYGLVSGCMTAQVNTFSVNSTCCLHAQQLLIFLPSHQNRPRTR